jgi:hypothetical protein
MSMFFWYELILLINFTGVVTYCLEYLKTNMLGDGHEAGKFEPDDVRPIVLEKIFAAIANGCSKIRSNALLGVSQGFPTAVEVYGFKNSLDFVYPRKESSTNDKFVATYKPLEDLPQAYVDLARALGVSMERVLWI